MSCQKFPEWSAVILSPYREAFGFPKEAGFHIENMQRNVLWTEVKSIHESINLHSLVSYIAGSPSITA